MINLPASTTLNRYQRVIDSTTATAAEKQKAFADFQDYSYQLFCQGYIYNQHKGRSKSGFWWVIVPERGAHV